MTSNRRRASQYRFQAGLVRHPPDLVGPRYPDAGQHEIREICEPRCVKTGCSVLCAHARRQDRGWLLCLVATFSGSQGITAVVCRQTSPLSQRASDPSRGRLAIDQKFTGRKLGEFLLLDALRRSLRQSGQVASTAVVVDAKDDSGRRFYQYFNFISLPGAPKPAFLADENDGKAILRIKFRIRLFCLFPCRIGLLKFLGLSVTLAHII